VDAVVVSSTKIYNSLKSLASSHPTNATVQLCTAQVALMNNETQYAYQLLISSNHTNSNPECIALKIQIYIKIDRIDLAQKELLHLQRIVGEDHVICELCMIYIALAIGTSQANDAEHRLITLSEQYGPSVYLLNILSIAFSVQGNYIMAEQKLQECLRDFQNEMTTAQKVETLMNLSCIYHQQPTTKVVEANTTINELLQQPSTGCSIQQFQMNYERVVSAYDREATRYMTH
jgi:Coatomer epsilon subunit